MAAAALAFIFIALGAWFFGGALYIAAKAEVAQVLLERAFQKTLETGKPEKPWAWADTWPVAKLIFPAEGRKVIVLDKTSGQALAFGPGLLPGQAAIGAPGTAVIAAHNDTHFAFLGDLKAGQVIGVLTDNGASFNFEVQGSDIVDIRKPITLAEGEGAYLVLSTCYPFHALAAGTPYRYLVTARLVSK